MRFVSPAKGILIVLLTAISLGVALYQADTKQWLSQVVEKQPTEPTPEQVQQIVDGIPLISGLPQKQGEPQWDEHAILLTKLGKLAGPILVGKLTDESPSQVVELFPYTIADVALSLLTDIYQVRSWPFPDNSTQIPIAYGDFRDYLAFVKTKGARERLQQSWKIYIQTH